MMELDINRYKNIRTILIFMYFSFYILISIITIGSGAAPTPISTVSQSETISNLTNQVRNLQSLTDFYKNETQNCRILYENESSNVSNKNIIEIKNNINIINQNITQIYENIKNMETNIKINFYLEILIEITLIGSLISIYYQYIRKSNEK